jgi:hypothetical protein
VALLACDDTLQERLWEPSGGGGIYRMGDGQGDGERRSPPLSCASRRQERRRSLSAGGERTCRSGKLTAR